MIRFDTFTTAIVDQFQSAYNGPAANMLAGVLVALLPRPARGSKCCVRGDERYARVGSGAARPPAAPAPRARATLPCLLLPVG